MLEKYQEWLDEQLEDADGDPLHESLIMEVDGEKAQRASQFEEATEEQYVWESPWLDKSECQRQMEAAGMSLAESATVDWPGGYRNVAPTVQRRLSDGAGTQRDQRRKRKSVDEVQLMLQAALETDDAARFLFATADQLAKLLSCDRKTVMQTPFWKDRRLKQQEHRRNN